jgi:dGTP triphosphohydrolase
LRARVNSSNSSGELEIFPADLRERLMKNVEPAESLRLVTDRIAGMMDAYAD